VKQSFFTIVFTEKSGPLLHERLHSIIAIPGESRSSFCTHYGLNVQSNVEKKQHTAVSPKHGLASRGPTPEPALDALEAENCTNRWLTRWACTQ
jgi:hypothetical protein